MTLFNKLRHRWLGAPLEDFYGVKARNYERTRSTNPKWDVEQDVYCDLVSQFPDGSTVLDVPFGSGRFADVYQRKQMSVIGIDSSSDMLAEAARLRSVTTAGFDLRVGDARRLPLADASVDLVVCCRFLVGIVSIGDARKVLAEFRRVVRTAAIVDLAVRHDHLPELRYPPRRTAPMNAKLTRPQLDSLLGDAGFAITSVHPTYEIPDAMRVAAVCRPQ
jgi:SAM-dependent methyltransferase